MRRFAEYQKVAKLYMAAQMMITQVYLVQLDNEADAKEIHDHLKKLFPENTNYLDGHWKTLLSMAESAAKERKRTAATQPAK